MVQTCRRRLKGWRPESDVKPQTHTDYEQSGMLICGLERVCVYMSVHVRGRLHVWQLDRRGFLRFQLNRGLICALRWAAHAPEGRTVEAYSQVGRSGSQQNHWPESRQTFGALKSLFWWNQKQSNWNPCFRQNPFLGLGHRDSASERIQVIDGDQLLQEMTLKSLSHHLLICPCYSFFTSNGWYFKRYRSSFFVYTFG